MDNADQAPRPTDADQPVETTVDSVDGSTRAHSDAAAPPAPPATGHQRTVLVERLAAGRLRATNRDGAQIEFGTASGQFSPVDLLLAALAGCMASTVEEPLTRHSEPVSLEIRASGIEATGTAGNALEDVSVHSTCVFPEDATRSFQTAPRLFAQAHDAYCTVSRALESVTPVSSHTAVGTQPSSAGEVTDPQVAHD